MLNALSTGRILNRFSKDIDTADVTIRFNIRMLLSMSVRAISAAIIISLETPFFILACLPLAALYYLLQVTTHFALLSDT